MLIRLNPGEIVERYRVEAILGEGGMAAVYRVTHTSLGTSHALKVLSTDQPDVRERMLAEGKMQATLSHPNILAVRDVIDVDGAPGLLMDLVNGGSLADLLEREPDDTVDRLEIFHAVLDGVALAHEHEMVHRDLKPANILLERRRGKHIPKIADFGLAKVLSDTEVRDYKTREGVPMGTPFYMAPEQVYDASTVDQRADLWALGVILYEMATGRRPFQAERQLAVLGKVIAGRYVDPIELDPDIDPRVVNAIRACLVVHPTVRVQDCATLRDILGGEPFELQGNAGLRATPSPGPSSTSSGDSATYIMDEDVVDSLHASMQDEGPAPEPPASSAASLPPVDTAAPAQAVEAPSVATLHPADPAPVAVPPVAAPPIWRQLRARWLLLLFLPALLAYSDRMWPVEARLWYPLLRTIQGSIEIEDVAIVAFGPHDDPRSLRPSYPEVIDQMVAAGASSVIFDVALITETEHDTAISDAIQRAHQAGVTVVLPVFADTIPPRLPESDALRSGPLGLVEFHRELFSGSVLRAPVLRHTVDGQTYWHATVQAVHAHLGAKRTFELDHNELVIGGTRNSTWAGLVWLHPTNEVEPLTWDDPASWGTSLQDRVVVFGSYGGARDLYLTPEGPRYGVEVHAGLVQTLLRQATLRVAPLPANALIALLTGLLTTLLGLYLPSNRRSVAAILPVAILGLLSSLMMANILFAFTPVIMAAIMAWFALRGLGRTQ